MRVAGLDLGTNTFLLLVADVSVDANGESKIDRVLNDEVRIVRLGQEVHKNRMFHPEALARAEETFRGFSEIIRAQKCERVLACATSAARDVGNKQILIDLGAKYGIPVEIISGEQEAEMTFRGTVDDLKESVVIIDVGGGSTEFIAGSPTGIDQRESVDIGSVRLTELFVHHHPVPADEMSAMTTYIYDKLEGIRIRFGPLKTKVVAVAGTPTTLAAVDQGLQFESNRVHGHILTKQKLQMWLEKMAKMTVEERRSLAGMEPKRADVIVAGTLTLLKSLEALGGNEMEVSVKGLRYGVAKFLGQPNSGAQKKRDPK